MTERELINYVGGGAEAGSKVFEGCKAELTYRVSTRANSIASKVMWVASIAAIASVLSSIVAIVSL